MFTVTFYSFKGGVGRTMALVNCAALLAQRGMKTLIVDFDLEAPSISGYRQFYESNNTEGLVDFVSEFVATASAPAVSRFIQKCHLPNDNLDMWIMPAGRRGEGYASKLGAIDWQDLYANRNGYLLFEDLRQQWRDHPAGFDYVLIDSRTGHTDVGGICTRQLADLDVLMFVPNSQNIMGMRGVVDDIRADDADRGRTTPILFCPSNVPDLDDEENILRTKLLSAQDILGYRGHDAIIHHYNSLSLIDDSIFILDRPTSRLSNEYRRLLNKIAEMNTGDKVGALHYLRSLKESLLFSPNLRGDALFIKTAQERMQSITTSQGGDGQVAWNMSEIFKILGNISSELSALNTAINAGVGGAEARLKRSLNLSSQGKTADAIADLHAFFGFTDAEGFQIASAIELLRAIDANWLDTVQSSAAIATLKAVDVSLVAEALMKDPKGLDFAYELIKGAIGDANTQGPGPLDNTLFLSLIGAGKFREAMEFYRKTDTEMLETTEIVEVFNYAMARWGYTGSPMPALFQHVIDLGDTRRSERDANFLQCLALCSTVIGDDARALLLVEAARSAVGPGEIFSCWRYLTVNRREMISDLADMEVAIRAGGVEPEFIRRHSKGTTH